MLPASRFSDHCARYSIWKLRALQGVRPDMPSEVRVRQELAGWAGHSGCRQADPLAMIPPHEAHPLGDVAVVGYDDGAIIDVQSAVVEQVHGEIDIPNPSPRS